MSQRYADIIIDISESSVDRPFRYKIPEEMNGKVHIGSVVKVPFGKGNRTRTGYVVGLALEPNYDINKIKSIAEVAKGAVSVESKLIQLAAWIRERYGCTMITALRTVMPVKEKVQERSSKIDLRDNIPTFRPIDALEGQQQEAVDIFIADLDKYESEIVENNNSDNTLPENENTDKANSDNINLDKANTDKANTDNINTDK
ncbi:MAG: hypothetical protein K6F55_04500, partial [Eubacterium sp.]|nr:hypothetical protein [Eubacterium sp.]